MAQSAEPEAPWVRVSDGRRPDANDARIGMRRVVIQLVCAGLVAMVLVAVGGAYASRRASERESVHDALQITDILADDVVQPVLLDGIVRGDRTAVSRLDAVVRQRVLGGQIMRVKLWDSSGRIVYSDEPRIVGRSFPLGPEELEVLAHPSTQAAVSDLKKPENEFERGERKLLEVYRPVWTPSGRPLLFETYSRYSSVTQRTSQLWRGFAGITVSSLLLMFAVLLPLGWALVSRLRRVQQEREAIWERTAQASEDERRRTAATLHDGVVQELAATSFVVAGAADRAAALGDAAMSGQLRTAAAAVRASIGGLRSLLVDIYPASLRRGGLAGALTDLAATARSRGLDVRLDLEPVEVGTSEASVIFRIAQECVRNVVRHANANAVDIELHRDDDAVALTISDDGVGFDVAGVLRSAVDGHLGVRLLADLAEQASAVLDVASAPGAGTRWRLVMPR